MYTEYVAQRREREKNIFFDTSFLIILEKYILKYFTLFSIYFKIGIIGTLST